MFDFWTDFKPSCPSTKELNALNVRLISCYWSSYYFDPVLFCEHTKLLKLVHLMIFFLKDASFVSIQTRKFKAAILENTL